MTINLPLMENNINKEDLNTVIDFLKTNPILTASKNVLAFEEEWSKWLGVKHSVFVSSGSAANLITLAALKHTSGIGEVIVPPLTWSSDIASVLHCGFKPIFADINPRNLAMAEKEIASKITNDTKAIFLTHILGFNGLTQNILDLAQDKKIPLIEDVCESHGATFKGKKLGTFGLMSNFSFYYAHHMSTIEGGMVCTNDENLYQILRMLRAHGMIRESNSDTVKRTYTKEHPDLNPDFIFAYPAYNVRSTEINAVLGRSQLKRLDENNKKRTRNFKLFLENLDPKKFRTDFDVEGSCNYAFVLILNKPDDKRRDLLETLMRSAQVEFRRGTSGGGNQMRQPYMKSILPKGEATKYSSVEHVHFYGYYIGNYPELSEAKIIQLCKLVNSVD